MPTIDSWNDAWSHVGAVPPEGLYGRIVSAYSEPHRAYHTLQHLDECLARLAPVAHLARGLGTVELAVWFHDAIYDTKATDNEAKSARWARAALQATDADREIADHVERLILATRHDAIPDDADARLLVDVDLSILGAEDGRFAEYEAQVRAEYRWVPEAAYCEGRSRVLRSFLDRPAIYFTPWFSDALEARARRNLTRSLAVLASSG